MLEHCPFILLIVKSCGILIYIQYGSIFFLRKKEDFPCDSVDKNPLANAEDSFDPWLGKISHAKEQLSLCTTTTDPALESPGAAATEAHS